MATPPLTKLGHPSQLAYRQCPAPQALAAVWTPSPYIAFEGTRRAALRRNMCQYAERSKSAESPTLGHTALVFGCYCDSKLFGAVLACVMLRWHPCANT